MNSTENGSRQDAPLQELENLDELWFQVGGTLCNLSCNHCFISCHPGNDNFGFMDLETIRNRGDLANAFGTWLDESEKDIARLPVQEQRELREELSERPQKDADL